ncbi:hypothetical protein [Plantibacter sp. M259]|uniref:hypothetical protein n=1 Tax=Plantibacter sp. M259 TaxID=2583822 RepID=UPI001F0D3536|nr:hypothetical protein [Plantibacter sp. M259]
MLRLIAFAALGALLGGVIVITVGPPDVGYAVAGVALPVFIMTSVLTLVARSVGNAVGASPQAVQQAKDARRLGVARVDALRQTGTQINDQPLCELDLTVQPLHGAAFASTMRTVVPLTAIPMFQPGTERDVAILLDGGPEVAFIDAGELAPAERSRLRVPARASVPFLPVEPHRRIVDGRRRGPLLGVGRAGRPGRFALFAIVAIAAAAIVVVPYHQSVAQAIAALEDGRLRPDLRRPGRSRRRSARSRKRSVMTVWCRSRSPPISSSSRRRSPWGTRRPTGGSTGMARSPTTARRASNPNRRPSSSPGRTSRSTASGR